MLYDTDYYLWTQQQAQALKEHNLNALDWENLREEIESLGKSEYAKVSSWLMRIIQHKLKIDYVAIPECLKHWNKEIISFQIKIKRHISPSMKNKLLNDLPELYADGVKLVLVDYEDVDLPEYCPYNLDELY
ncbi:protein of unknown function DUF29 [Gloeothece citriformis PCC 7424]|uniref:DUF29 domain-containing protein n=1 Tax=Gloeothece citriformis (strain PCC 7424) TaxID=65393 RepID=B7KDP8_GLOC7|nr:DUF29 domain-containing protein [Gloeothece citriformis]ACK70350.1 protein of unknown function DUF29 [Gloeothece citriformis PCC 7424]